MNNYFRKRLTKKIRVEKNKFKLKARQTIRMYKLRTLSSLTILIPAFQNNLEKMMGMIRNKIQKILVKKRAKYIVVVRWQINKPQKQKINWTNRKN